MEIHSNPDSVSSSKQGGVKYNFVTWISGVLLCVSHHTPFPSLSPIALPRFRSPPIYLGQGTGPLRGPSYDRRVSETSSVRSSENYSKSTESSWHWIGKLLPVHWFCRQLWVCLERQRRVTVDHS
ncbi:hypothetical protein VTN02DRAFT_2781 [Thermoascus thermophilus]